MNPTFHISSYCHVKNSSIYLNGTEVFTTSNHEFTAFIKSAATHLEINYPKLYKMDPLSKLAFLAAETLLNSTSLSADNDRNIAIILSNRASSLVTDRQHQSAINDPEDFFPSPSIFVYTLPNICIGEISIRHRMHSENCFFIFDAFNADHLWINAENLLKSKKAKKVLCGWVEFDDNNYEAFLYLVEENGNFAHSPKEIKRLYKS